MLPRIYKSGDTGAPVANGVHGSPLNILKACLVDGYGSQAVSTMTSVGDLVTVTTLVAHNISGNQTQTISGANEAGYNGTFRVTVTGTDTFTYISSGIIDVTATGTILTMTPPAGWTIEYEEGTTGVFRNNPVTGTGFYMRVAPTSGSHYSDCRFYESMTSINDGLLEFHTVGVSEIFTSDGSSSTPRPWLLIADDRFFYWWCWVQATTLSLPPNTGSHSMAAGDFVSIWPNDYWCFGAIGNPFANRGWGYAFTSTTGAGYSFYAIGFARSYTGAAGQVQGINVNGGGPGNLNYPGYTGAYSPGDPIILARNYVNNGAGYTIRGFFPGYYNPCHNNAFSQYQEIVIDGRTYLSIRCSVDTYGCNKFILVSHDWRT